MELESWLHVEEMALLPKIVPTAPALVGSTKVSVHKKPVTAALIH